MTLYKVLFLTLCCLFSIKFALCTENSTEPSDEEIRQRLWNALRQYELQRNRTEAERNSTTRGDNEDFFRHTYLPRITECGQPWKAHRQVRLLGNRDVFGWTVNFTDPTDNRLIEVDEFLGIPYATRPIWHGQRFAPTVDPRYWYGIVHNHVMERGCIQPTSSHAPWAVHDDDKENLSEDCLYLNVWTPFNQSSQGNKKPVLLFVHGGFFSTGSNRQKIYDGRVLAGLGDIVVVTVSYRLGPFGFWTSGRKSAPGNAALFDIYRAYNFCFENIQYLGGDPWRITLAGQGAGAVALSMLSSAHKIPRNWNRIVLQSGSMINPFPADPEETLIHSYNLAIGVGCANESYLLQEHPEEVEACMIGVDPFVLAEEESKMRLRPGPYTGFIPTWNLSVYPNHPYRDLLEGDHDIQEMIIGTNHFDGAFQIAASDPDRFGYFFEKENAIIDANETKGIFSKMFPYVNSSDVDEVFQIYNTSEEFNNVENETLIPSLQLARAVTDLSFTCPSLFFAEKMMAKKVKVYFYDFKFKPSDGNSPWPQWMRPTHFEEVQYVFGKPFLDAEKYSAEEIELSRLMIQTWANFTKMIPTWPRFDFVQQPSNDSFLESPDVQVTDQMPQLEQCNVFRKYFGRSLL